ncbi:MAG: diguanylate cyclase [Actinobacteria bacterium]|nr:diguanylate cyclase [Actinomycetota bacterium]
MPAVTGAAALLLPAVHALVVALALAVGALVSRRYPQRQLAAAAALAGGVVAAVAARAALTARVGPPGPASLEGILPLAGAAVALVLAWQLVGAIADRTLRARVGGEVWPTTRNARWVQDAALAASAVVVAVLWHVFPLLALAALFPLFAGARVVDHGGRGAVAIDRVTGLPTAGAIRAALADEAARARRFHRSVAVLVVDLDQIGDHKRKVGQPVGQGLLRAVAAHLQALSREYDVVGRLSGDEFVVLCPEADVVGARAVAERIRAGLAAEPFRMGTAEAPVAVTASVGLAMFPDDSDDLDQLLVEAELAASYARSQGGDRVCLAALLPEEFRGVAAYDAAAYRFVGAVPVAPAAEPLPAPGRDGDREVAPDRLVKVASEPLAHAKPSTDRLLGAVGVAASVAVAVGAVAGPAPRHWGAVLVFAALAVGAEWFAASVYGRSSSSWSAVPLVAFAAVAMSPVEVALACVLAGVGGGALRGTRVRQAAFNVAVLVLSGLSSFLTVQMLTAVDVDATGSLLEALIVGLVAGPAFFVVNVWLVATAVAASGRAPVWDVWREDLLWLVPHQLGMGALAGASALVYHLIGAEGALLLSLPAVGLHLAQRQFLNRTRQNVVRLRELNDDLSDANTRVVRVNERLTDALGQVNAGYLATVESLAAAVDAKDTYTGSHIDRVEAYGRLLLQLIDPELRDDEQMLWGFRLHDVGKIGVPDSILLKPGPLDDQEWVVMRRHPEIGAQIIQAAPFLQGARDIVLHHHERWDGGGYPRGLCGQAIPFGARLFSLVDAFDAMTSDRPYRTAMSIDQALEELRRNSGTQFDPEMIEGMLQLPRTSLEEVPVQVASRRHATRRRAAAGGLLLPITADVYDALDEPARVHIVAR